MEEIKKQISRSKLLAGRVLGSLNEEREHALPEWEDANDNMQLERSILNAQAFEQWTAEADGLDTSRQWDAFLHKMQKTQSGAKIIRMKLYKALASVAAILFIGFSLYYAYGLTNIENRYRTVDEGNILPGSPHAQLVLADGETVNLEAAGKDLISEGNVSIVNAKGVLAYNLKDKKTVLQPVCNVLKIPRGGEYQLVLPDGTKVCLNSDSELKYTVPFSGNERRVQLKGEAYFEVARNKAKPFIVETNHQSVEVLGTKFNVSAYAEDVNVVTTLVEGKVKVKHAIDENSIAEEFLLPDEQLIFNKETSGTSKETVETYPYTSWKDGRFAFESETLESFFTKIARWYNVEVFITDESIKAIRFTGDLPRYKNMTDILKIVEAEMSVHIEIEDNKVICVSR